MDLKIILDPINFPMIYIESGNFYMHWLPVTKIQLEYWLSSGGVNTYDARWYNEVLDYNPRVSPGFIKSDNYWGAFVTGVTPIEIKQFIAWLGRDYDIPTAGQWQLAYQHLKKETANPQYVEQLLNVPNLNRRAKTLIKNIDISINEVGTSTQMRGGRTVADQALMRLGVMEYVYRDDRRNTYGGYGQPVGAFFGTTETPDKGYPQRLIDEQDGAKMPHYGFRLIKKG